MKLKNTDDMETFMWAWIRWYQQILLLQDHEITLEYNKKIDSETIMECRPRFPYKSIDIEYGDVALEHWEKPNHGELKQTILHELCHAITEPLYRIGTQRYATESQMEDMRELVTDHISNIIYKYERGREA